jgi:hypothetical protein
MYPQCTVSSGALDVKQIEASVKTHVFKAPASDVTVSINIHKNKASVNLYCQDTCWPEPEFEGPCPYGLVRVYLMRCLLQERLTSNIGTKEQGCMYCT